MLKLFFGRLAAPGVTDLKEKEFLEDHPPLRRGPKPIEILDLRLVRREVRLLERRPPRHQLKAFADLVREHVRDCRG